MSGNENPQRPPGLTTSPPRYPEYSSPESRLASYTGWPETVVRLTPLRLANCGFFYIGSADRVRCFHCGITLRNWEAEDDPIAEHLNWSPQCPVVTTLMLGEGAQTGFRDLQTPGEDLGEDVASAREVSSAGNLEQLGLGVNFNLASGDSAPTANPSPSVSTSSAVAGPVTGAVGGSMSQPPDAPHSLSIQASARSENDNVTPSSSSQSQGRQSEQTLTPMVQAVLAMGYSLDTVNRMRESKRQRDGTDFTDASSLLTAIFEEESQEPSLAAGVREPATNPFRQTADRSSSLESGQGAPSANSRRPEEHSSGGAVAQPSSADAQVLLRRVRPGHCQMCGVAEITVTFLPCGHLITCQDCARQTRTCPKCHKTILGTIKTYFA